MKILLNTFDIQEGSLGRPFQQVGLRKNSQLPSKWINGSEHWYWIYTFRYLDGSESSFEIEIDYYNKMTKL